MIQEECNCNGRCSHTQVRLSYNNAYAYKDAPTPQLRLGGGSRPSHTVTRLPRAVPLGAVVLR